MFEALSALHWLKPSFRGSASPVGHLGPARSGKKNGPPWADMAPRAGGSSPKATWTRFDAIVSPTNLSEKHELILPQRQDARRSPKTDQRRRSLFPRAGRNRFVRSLFPP
jgi:hypothetical protein